MARRLRQATDEYPPPSPLMVAWFSVARYIFISAAEGVRHGGDDVHVVPVSAACACLVGVLRPAQRVLSGDLPRPQGDVFQPPSAGLLVEALVRFATYCIGVRCASLMVQVFVLRLVCCEAAKGLYVHVVVVEVLFGTSTAFT